jgi:hypothetical protein
MMPTSSITSAPGGLHELRLQGLFTHPLWVSFLFTGLFESQVSVVSGRALRDDSHCWDARLLLDFGRSTSTPDGLDYVALAQRKPAAADMAAPRLSRFETLRLLNGSLQMVLEGPDQIGFLGRLLSRVSLLTLFPTEIEINTVAGAIHDRIVMRGIGNSAPPPTAEESLKTLLSGFVS